MTHFVLAAVLSLTVSAGQGGNGQISGRVFDDGTHRPLSGVRVFLYPLPIPSPTPATYRPELSVTNEQGEYRFVGLQPGSYRIGMNKKGFYRAEGTINPLVSVVEGGSVGSVDLLMTYGAELRGHILDIAGVPLGNVFVSAYRVDGAKELSQLVAMVETDRTTVVGEFHVGGLQPGRYVIVANDQSNGPTDSLTYFPGVMTLADATLVGWTEEVVDGLNFKLGEWPLFEVSGTVLDGAGRPAVGQLVTVYAPRAIFGGRINSRVTDADGRFRIGELMAGPFRLIVDAPGARSWPITLRTPFVPFEVVDRDVELPPVTVRVR